MINSTEPQAKATVSCVLTNNEMCNQLVLWATGLGDTSAGR